VDVHSVSDEAAGRKAAEAVSAFIAEVGLPSSFRETGVPEDDLEACAEMTLSDGAIVQNPKPVTDSADVLGVLKAAWSGKPA